jgi:hypothetical protein
MVVAFDKCCAMIENLAYAAWIARHHALGSEEIVAISEHTPCRGPAIGRAPRPLHGGRSLRRAPSRNANLFHCWDGVTLAKPLVHCELVEPKRRCIRRKRAPSRG